MLGRQQAQSAHQSINSPQRFDKDEGQVKWPPGSEVTSKGFQNWRRDESITHIPVIEGDRDRISKQPLPDMKPDEFLQRENRLAAHSRELALEFVGQNRRVPGIEINVCDPV